MLSFITRYLKPEIEIREASQLREGPACVEGVAAEPEDALVTPFRAKRCIAYSYRGFRSVQGRGGAMPSLVKDVMVYSTFPLQIDGAVIHARPSKPAPEVTVDEHRVIQEGEGVYIDETVINWGRRVRVEGMLVRAGDDWEIRFKQLEDLGTVTDDRNPQERRDRRRRRNRK